MILKWKYVPIWCYDHSDAEWYIREIKAILHQSKDGLNWTAVDCDPFPSQDDINRMVLETNPSKKENNGGKNGL